MADQSQASDTSALVWEKATTQNGDTYEVGRDKAEVQKAEEAKGEGDDSTADFKKGFTVSVNWTLGDGNWQSTDPDVSKTTAITRYRIYRNEGVKLFKYSLEFTNLEHYDYYFTDGEGDNYECNTWLNGNHVVRFNSPIPKIVQVKGD